MESEFFELWPSRLVFFSHAVPKKISSKNTAIFFSCGVLPQKYPLETKSYFSFDVTNLYIDVAAIWT